MLRFLAFFAVLCFFGFSPALISAQGTEATLLTQLFGTDYAESFGSSVAAAGDVDNDGDIDFIVGSPDADGNGPESGRVSVISGADGTLLYVIDGEAAGDRFGASVSAFGDVDGNGFNDFLIGAPDSDGNGADSGRVYAILSGTNGYFFYNGPAAGARFGESLDAAGDVNGDGYLDAIIGARGDDSAFLISGFDWSVINAFAGPVGSEFGTSVGGAGDVNGDGFDDVIVGAQFDDTAASIAGAARVYSGFDGDLLHTFLGQENDELGWAVSGAGDVNGDGADDLLVGIPAREKVHIYSGETGDLLHIIEEDESWFGGSLSDIGDANGDGSDDVIIGSEARFAGIYSGFNGSSLATFTEIDPSDLGASVNCLGDLDGDGFPEVIIGDPGYTDDPVAGFDLGTALIYSLVPVVSPTEVFRRGDANLDGGFNIADEIYLLAALFSGGPTCECPDSCDQNDDGSVNIADAIYGLAALFSGGTTPPDPGPNNCGADPTDDVLADCIYDAAC